MLEHEKYLTRLLFEVGQVMDAYHYKGEALPWEELGRILPKVETVIKGMKSLEQTVGKRFASVTGYSSLTDDQQKLLERVYAVHMTAMGTEMRKNYTIDKVIKVKWDSEEKTVNIYFSNTWWHYTSKGTWY